MTNLRSQVIREENGEVNITSFVRANTPGQEDIVGVNELIYHAVEWSIVYHAGSREAELTMNMLMRACDLADDWMANSFEEQLRNVSSDDEENDENDNEDDDGRRKEEPRPKNKRPDRSDEDAEDQWRSK